MIPGDRVPGDPVRGDPIPGDPIPEYPVSMDLAQRAQAWITDDPSLVDRIQ